MDMNMYNLIAMKIGAGLGNVINLDMEQAKAAGLDYKDWWTGVHSALCALMSSHLEAGTKGDRKKHAALLKFTIKVLNAHLESLTATPNSKDVVEDFLKGLHKPKED